MWIDQGAKGGVSAGAGVVWQPLPAGVNPIYAVAITPDGQYAAASRANQIFVYHVPSKRALGRLTDPKLLESGLYKGPGVADLDLIQSLAFSPDGQLLASGGFRTAKLWRRGRNVRKAEWPGLDSPGTAVSCQPRRPLDRHRPGERQDPCVRRGDRCCVPDAGGAYGSRSWSGFQCRCGAADFRVRRTRRCACGTWPTAN